MKQQDMVWVNLPFSNLEESKVRPAVVMSNGNYNRSSNDVLVCAVTSNLDPKPHSVMIGQESLSGGKLPIKSRIRADKIFQVEKNLIAAPFARINDVVFDSVVAELASLLKRDDAQDG